MNLSLPSLTLLAAMCAFINTHAQSASFSSDTGDNDIEVRENPVIDGLDENFDFNVPPFIREKHNQIDFNGADWTSLRARLENAETIPFTIVHIGDSHIQADYATGDTRNYLQFDYGDAGRGLITPLRISGTNQPTDYTFTGAGSWSGVKLMSQSWPRTMGFTGTSVSPSASTSSFTIATSEKDDYKPFASVTVFHKGQFFVTSITDSDGHLIPFVSKPSQDYTHISLVNEVTSAKINFDSAGDLTIFGVNLSGNRPGLFYHTIGNNGATYDTYNRIGSVGSGIAPLYPDLVIISLGTNEAFGRLDTLALMKSIDRLVDNIRKYNSEAQILLVTPMECQRSTYTSVKGKGKRRRRSTQRVKTYKINTNIEPIRNAIKKYGKEHHVAVYDWYQVAGGDNASTKWINDGLFSHDRVHHSHKGYKLQGFLLYQALRKAFTE